MDSWQNRLEAHQPWQLERAIRECRDPAAVQIVDTGKPGAIGAPRYRLQLVGRALAPDSI